MKESKKEDNICEKLAEIRDFVDSLTKSKQGFGYKYTDILDILVKIRVKMKKLGLMLMPEVVPNTLVTEQRVINTTKTTKDGRPYTSISNEEVVKADMVFTWINIHNPEEHIRVPWIVVGSQSDVSQAFGSGLTYSLRYFLTTYFQIPQDNDPDTIRSKQKQAEQDEVTEILNKIKKNISDNMKEYLAKYDNDEEKASKRAEISKVIQSIAGVKNPNVISDPNIAASVLDALQKEFIDKEEE